MIILAGQFLLSLSTKPQVSVLNHETLFSLMIALLQFNPNVSQFPPIMAVELWRDLVFCTWLSNTLDRKIRMEHGVQCLRSLHSLEKRTGKKGAAAVSDGFCNIVVRLTSLLDDWMSHLVLSGRVYSPSTELLLSSRPRAALYLVLEN